MKISIRQYLVKVLNGMALGLFSSLIIGLILKQIGELTGIVQISYFGEYAQLFMGPAIGAGVAYSLGISPLGIISSIIAGGIGAGSIKFVDASAIITIGEPVGAFIASLIAGEVSKIINGKTKFDIVLVPGVTILAGGIVGIFISPVISMAMKEIGSFINLATNLRPIPMGIILSVCMGILLTLPVSSAAIAISLGLSGIAAGASLVGCCCQMVGFAIISYGDNGIGESIAQGLGTSMLQIPNIIKNPRIWIPPILASAILGPISTTILLMESNSIGAGMGTSGLVGQFGTIDAMGNQIGNLLLFKIGIIHFILPGIISYIVYRYLVKINWIKKNDLKLS